MNAYGGGVVILLYMGAGTGDDQEELMTPDTAVEELNGDVVTVDALNTAIGELVESEARSFDYITGDCSDRYVSSAGHLHFDLVHDDSTLHCLVYSFRRNSIGDEISEDAHLAVQGDLSYYAEEGQVSVIVEDAVTVGDSEYAALYEQNHEALADDGLLDDDAKLALPEHPEKIGLVTSSESDAREDAITSLHARHPGVDIVVQDTPVQGDRAMESVLEAISVLDRDTTVDVIGVTRGGGADKHLRVFNELPLCRVVAGTDTPIVAAIGHENDDVLVGDVADARAMTPTHVGETVLTYAYDDFLADVEALGGRLENAYERHATATLTGRASALDAAYEDLAVSRLSQLDTTLSHRYESVVTSLLADYEHRLESAYREFEQRQEHEAEKQSYQRRQKALAAAVIVLVLVILGLVIFVL